MKRLLLMAVATFALAGCNEKAAQKAAPTTNPVFTVEFLFEHDGCRINRFFDARTVYFVTCPTGGKRAQITWPQNCGKNCTQMVSVSTD